MICQKCGKEIEENVKFCPSCGQATEQKAIKENIITLQTVESNTNANVETVAPTKKKKRKWPIVVAVCVVAFIILIFAMGGSDESGLDDTGSLEESGLTISADNDSDGFGKSSSENFGFTLEEFVNRYNKTVDAHLINDTTEDMFADIQQTVKLNIDYFVQDEENEDFYIAENENNFWYIVRLDESDQNVSVVSFNFSTKSDVMLTLCKWLMEAIKPNMGFDYYSNALSSTIKNGEKKEDGIAYFWETDREYYSFSVYYAS